jgi:hypothetical protein
MTEIIVGIENPDIPDCMLNFRPDDPAQCVKLLLMDDVTGKLRRIISTLDHRSKWYTVSDKPPDDGAKIGSEILVNGKPLRDNPPFVRDQS